MSRLTAYVHVHLPEGGTVVYGPDDEVPAEHAALIINPGAWVGGVVPELDQAPAPPNPPVDEEVVSAGPDDTEPTDPAPANADTSEPDTEPPAVTPASTVPPRSGPGSGGSAWAEYATAHGVDVPPNAGRAGIIAALTAAGVAVE